jgi:hypothetical protein
VFLILFVEPHMDRYWLFVLAVIAVWWMMVVVLKKTLPHVTGSHWRWSPTAVAWAIVCLTLNVGISTAFTHDMLAWNNVRWQYVNTQLANGVRAEAIDGGRDVNAWLRLDEDVNSMPREGDTTPWWSGRSIRALAVGARPGWHEIDRLPWTSWATGREHYLLVLQREVIGTGQPDSTLTPREMLP